jgi:hypothetical protein
MHCPRTFAVLTSAVLTVGLAWGQARIPRQPASPNNTANAQTRPRQKNVAPGPVVSPATVNFSATNPDTLPSVLGTPVTTFAYNNVDYPGGGTGTLSVGATGFTGGTACGNIPVSAMTVTCVSAHSSLSCATASCIAGSPQLTSAGVPIATGTVGSGGSCTPNFTITLNYNFADNWKYTAETCSLLVTYNVIAY